MPTLIDRRRPTASPSASPPPSSAPPIDPRIRARLMAVQYAAARRRRRWVIALASVALVLAAAIGVSRSPLLAVHHVRLTGAGHTTTAEVLSATGLNREPLMIGLGLGRVRAELEALPWVATAGVQRRWPTTVVIHLTERVPVAVVPDAAGGSALLDPTGRVLAVGAGPGKRCADDQRPDARRGTRIIPASGGGGGRRPRPGHRPRPPSSRRRRRQIKDIVVAGGTLDLKLSGGAMVTFGTAADLDAKLLALHTVLQRVDLKGIAAIDLRLPSAPVLTHATQGGTVSTTPRG